MRLAIPRQRAIACRNLPSLLLLDLRAGTFRRCKRPRPAWGLVAVPGGVPCFGGVRDLEQ